MIAFLNDALFSIAWPWSFIIVLGSMALLAIFAYIKKSLNLSGCFAAYVLGTVVLWTLRFEGFLLLALFFVGSNVIGKISKKIRTANKASIGIIEVEKKGSRRDAMQVMANGLMAVIAALLWIVSAKYEALIMFGASVAEATAATFAGEIGRLSKKEPVSILTFKPVEPGLSGGVTLLGTISAFLASAMIAICWYLWFEGVSLASMFLVCLLGFTGAVIDSYLGAWAQAIYKDPKTGKLTEHDSKNGQPLELVRGVRWLDNDMVNLISNVFSAVFALGMSAIIL